MLEVNVTANFSLGRHAAEQMASRGGGSITFITSIAAGTPMPNNVAYAASKAGLTSMAMSLAAAYAGHGVRVNCVAPGLIRSFSSRSEEHTSELQSLMRISYAVFCLNKKKTYQHHTYN